MAAARQVPALRSPHRFFALTRGDSAA